MEKFIPQIISNGDYNIYGILRKGINSKRIFIILPANTGTRIGPQRIFTEIAMELLCLNISSFCADIQPSGDSFDNEIIDFKGSFFEKLSQKYSYYIDAIIRHLNENYEFEEFNLLSISYGCIPCFMYAVQNKISRLVLLSPDNIIGQIETFNKKNIKSYYYKLFRKSTWFKIFNFQLNLNQIIKNIYSTNTKYAKNIGHLNKDILSSNIDLKVLSIFGEKDLNYKYYLNYWTPILKKYNILNYEYQIVRNSDHSFFGWQFKRDVEKYIVNWLSV